MSGIFHKFYLKQSRAGQADDFQDLPFRIRLGKVDRDTLCRVRLRRMLQYPFQVSLSDS